MRTAFLYISLIVLVFAAAGAVWAVPKKGGDRMEKAIFAGGCFWCMTGPFKEQEGVSRVVAGYTDGKGGDPTYDDYAKRGFTEAVEITYDPAKVSYKELLDIFWRQIDPTDEGGQFADRGKAYQTAIYYLDKEQHVLAQKSKNGLIRSKRFKKPIMTRIEKASRFWPAEEYHQDYYRKNPERYKRYKIGSGRADFIHKAWSEMVKTKDDLKKKLTDLQYRVTQDAETEPPFRNQYWDNHEEGIYVDVVSGEPLFSSKDKFDSGTGWPCFKKPIEEGILVQKPDFSLSIERTEVRSKEGDSHLGHVFDDGPGPTGKRYCINSAALRFVPREDLEKEGYGKYLKIFAE